MNALYPAFNFTLPGGSSVTIWAITLDKARSLRRPEKIRTLAEGALLALLHGVVKTVSLS